MSFSHLEFIQVYENIYFSNLIWEFTWHPNVSQRKNPVLQKWKTFVRCYYRLWEHICFSRSNGKCIRNNCQGKSSHSRLKLSKDVITGLKVFIFWRFLIYNKKGLQHLLVHESHFSCPSVLVGSCQFSVPIKNTFLPLFFWSQLWLSRTYAKSTNNSNLSNCSHQWWLTAHGLRPA